MSKWVAGSRSVAALFAAWIVMLGMALLGGLGDGAEALELLAHERLVLVVSRREVRPHPGELHPLVGRDRVDQRGNLGGVAQAEPSHARVVLHVDSRDHTQLLRDGAQELARRIPPYRDLGLRSEGLADLLARDRAHHQDRGIGYLGAERGRLAGGRDRKHRGATLERCAGALGHAVSVAVCLYYRAHRSARLQHPGEVRDVPLDRAQVDPGDSAFHGRSPAGSASMTSLAITDSAAPTCSAAATPAFVLAHTPAHAASNGLEALREQRADGARQHVARAGSRERRG